jgi:uncharacterized protein (DUF952 family)
VGKWASGQVLENFTHYALRTTITGMILHITRRVDWETAVANNQYTAASLEREGFIHCSTIDQVLQPANALFRGQRDLVLLCIDPARVQAAIVYEDCYEIGQAFPHIYGRLNPDAVLQVVNFPPNPDGSFSLPPIIQQRKEGR